ncbi:methyl-accepting chemotaxis protein [Solimicrobium silvestre]|uniref:Methyl-accepting chemotaxis protein (MCP) signaling domain n=1 Tax=Solimicrobium silvestre TaxID=2099400 RepID=A0A2S9H4A9_9BURK|nr:methyl-accepting chemotaxis protein [Solimicrobium silvestre]PRC94798.1 Methyl-accepting chemotaxis protein (MCP) signaling domain [Solimicrobium silvestre]
MHKLMNSFQIRTRLLLINALILIGVALMTMVSLYSLRASMMEERSAKIVSVIDSATSVVNHFHQLQQEGKLTEAQAKEQALGVLRAVKYEGSNYVFIYDTDGMKLAPMPAPEMAGKSFKDLKDSTGKYFIQEMLDDAQSKGFGFVAYQFPKAGQTEELPKLSYISYFTDWKWMLGTGVYIDDVNHKFYASARTNVGMGIAMLIVISFITVMISRGILGQLGGEPNYAVEVVTQVAQGNLTMRANLHPTDKTSLLAQLQRMIEELRQLLLLVRNASESIDSAATEIAQGNLDLSGRTESQSASLEETASSMNQLTSTVRQNSESARQASDLAHTASKVAIHGGSVVRNVVVTMESIKNSSSKIVDIISVIDSIAFQTNILALNAAVEAARAGEQGRGFAVVASEVRALAHRSAAAAKEIKELIQQSVENIQSGATLVDDAGKAMDEIVNSVKSVTEIMTEIAQASKEQTQGIEQVNSAIAEMEGVTQQNAALVEEAAAAAQSMRDQSRSLVESVNTFRLE